MIKVLGLALYGPLAASNRYRLGQYVAGLAAQGIDLQVRPLLNDDYLRLRFGGRTIPFSLALQAGITRFSDLFQQSEYDLVMLHCELFPFLPGWIERALIRKPYIYDFDDAFYLKYKSKRMKMVRPFLDHKFDKVLADAAVVTAGNHELAQYAKQFNANVNYLPTVVDTQQYIPSFNQRDKELFTIGWIGSPSTVPYLNELIEPLSTIGIEHAIQFIVIGGKAPIIPNVQVVEVAWNEDTEIDLINSFDVGVMPLPNDDWARGKCAFKLIQYMACAVPVIASPVGANIDVVTPECGFMAATTQEWVAAFRQLINQPSKRVEMGRAGREQVEQHYSLRQNLPVLESVIRESLSK